jgi:hypothetical protein
VRVLGHQLSLSFLPIDESAVAGWKAGTAGGPKGSPEFEAAVKEIAKGLTKELRFLDLWWERVRASDARRRERVPIQNTICGRRGARAKRARRKRRRGCWHPSFMGSRSKKKALLLSVSRGLAQRSWCCCPSAAEAGRTSGCRGETPRTPPAHVLGRTCARPRDSTPPPPTLTPMACCFARRYSEADSSGPRLRVCWRG